MVTEIYDKVEPMLIEFEALTASLNDIIKNLKNAPIEKIFTEEYAQMAISQEDIKLKIKETKNKINETAIAYFEEKKKELENNEDFVDLVNNLIKVLKSKDRKGEDYVIASDIFCVSASLQKRVEVLFDKIDEAYKKIALETPEEKPSPNLNTIKAIDSRLIEIMYLASKPGSINTYAVNEDKTIGSKVPLEYYFEYLNLLAIKDCLEHAPKDYNDDLNPGDLYVRDEDKEKVTELIALTPFFGGKKIKETEIQTNINEIKKLEEYKKSLERKCNQAKNIPGVELTTMSDGTILLADDGDEYSYIDAIINTLKDVDLNIENVWNIGYVKSANIPVFRQLVNKTIYYDELVPKIPENEEILKNIDIRLQEIEDKAKLEGKILESEEEEYHLLIEQYECLKSAQASMELVSVEGSLVDIHSAPGYAILLNKIANLKKSPQDKGKDKPDDKGLLPPALPPKAKSEKKEQKPKRKKIIKVRKLNPKNKLKINKNWRKIFGIGLALILVTLALSELAPMLIYANCCNAIAMPTYSAAFNTINEGLALFTKFSIADINMSAAAANTFGAYMSSLIPTATATGGLILANGLVREDEILKVPSPSIRTKIYEKIVSLAKKPGEILKNIQKDINFEIGYLKAKKEKNKHSEHFKYFVEGILKTWAPKLDDEQALLAKWREKFEETALPLDNIDIDKNNNLNYRNDYFNSNNAYEASSYTPSPKPESETFIPLTHEEPESEYKEKPEFHHIPPNALTPDEEVENPEDFIAANVEKFSPKSEELSIPTSNMDDIYKAFILNQIDTYQEKVEKGESVKQIRDFIFSKTAVDLNDYDLKDFNLVKEAIIRILNLDNIGLVLHFEQKIKSLQETLDELTMNKDYLKDMEALAKIDESIKKEVEEIKTYFEEISPDLLITTLNEDIEALNNTLDFVKNGRGR